MAFIVDDLLLGPAKIMTWVGKTLYEHAQAQLTDESAVRQRLLDIQMQFELEQINEAQYREQETALIQRLDKIRKYKESHGI